MSNRLLTLVGAGALGAVMMLAQPPMAGRGGAGHGNMPGGGPMSGPGAATADGAQRGMALMAKILDLTGDQITQAEAIRKEAQTAMQALAPQLKEQQQAVQDAVKNNPSETAILDLAKKQGDLSAQMAAIRIRSMAKFYAILTPQQRDKAAELRGQMQGMFGGGRGWFGF